MTNKEDEKPTIGQVIKSVLAAMFGVQSEANRKRDFSKGNFASFVVVGIIFTALFVLLLVGVVQWVLKQSSP